MSCHGASGRSATAGTYGSQRVKVEPNPSVMHRRLADRMVLIHLQTNDIFDLSETSARLWELLPHDGDIAALEAQLAQEFEVDAAQLHREVAATLATFSRNDLISGYDPS